MTKQSPHWDNPHPGPLHLGGGEGQGGGGAFWIKRIARRGVREIRATFHGVSPQPFYSVSIQRVVTADEGQILHQTLRNQHPVKGIAVEQREADDPEGVLRRDVKQGEMVGRELFRKEFFKGFRRASLPRLVLMAISQTLAMLKNRSVSWASRSSFAFALNCGASVTNHKNVCVSARIFKPCMV